VTIPGKQFTVTEYGMRKQRPMYINMQRSVVINVMVELQALPSTARYLVMVSVTDCHAVSFSREKQLRLVINDNISHGHTTIVTCKLPLWNRE
jgi:hypothetical protein